MRRIRVVESGLFIACCFVIAAGLATPGAVGNAVGSDEARAVMGADCWTTQNGSSTISCSQATAAPHNACTESTCAVDRLWLWPTPPVCQGICTNTCPCGAGTYPVTQGLCTGS